ncbi:thiol:disulfide interchange protein, DsbA family [Shewanella sediminis HAW-EB3]|uniref:Thiol:disulfide interchange protein n=1 Tax=Shewanella sediminis (strain HAW-EB3) TaxID=425104 RepID=A8FPS4_SHESH|nr:thiol:disulfide interchange protein DsbA/DsbL [Shewanella sediminis]ABV34847.1 thiol:disulfide interchange protein, DsbA family [Shewanella sediminis HAW-EB3]
MIKLLSTAAILLSFGASAASFTQGEHYVDLGEAAFNAPNQVTKVYSVNCPFCYKYEKAVIPGFVKNLPDGVSFDSYHITTKPPFGKEKATVIAVAKVLGDKQYKTAKMAYYKHIHDDKKKFSSAEDAISFGLKAAKIDSVTFSAHKDTSEVKALLTQWDQGVAVAKVRGIPAIVVNGKYLINTKTITSMTMLDELTAELLEK